MTLVKANRPDSRNIKEGQHTAARLLEAIANTTVWDDKAAVVIIDKQGVCHTYQFGCDHKPMSLAAQALLSYALEMCND